MLVALLKRPPQFGSTVKSFDATAASAVPGVGKVVAVPRGVAVIAKTFWAAKLGRDALRVEWDDTHAEKRGSAELMDEYRRLADQPAQGRDVLSVQERQPAALHGVDHGLFHSRVFTQQGADFLGVAVHGRRGQPDRWKLHAGLGLGAPQTEAR